MVVVTRCPAAHVTQKQFERLCLEIPPQRGRWAEDGYLWLTDRTNRLIELADGDIG